jgi:2,3-bisphosphoglycerate-dependent phosphoglycerate mutase
MSAKLILMRHGESVWNQQNLFTGWVDIPMNQKGIEESIEGGKKIRDEPIDVVFTSALIRAQMTVALALLNHASGKVPVFQHPGEAWSQIHSESTQKQTIPVFMASELNERMYGKLQGLNKAETAKKYGAEQVQLWRRSFDVAPPEGESLEMTAQRTWPYFQKKILPLLEKGQNVFIAAHGNSLRSILMHIQKLTPQEVVALEIATGEPMIYQYEKGQWRVQ